MKLIRIEVERQYNAQYFELARAGLSAFLEAQGLPALSAFRAPTAAERGSVAADQGYPAATATAAAAAAPTNPATTATAAPVLSFPDFPEHPDATVYFDDAR